MGGVSGVGGSGSTQDINRDSKVDDVKQQNKLDQTALDAQLDKQSQASSSGGMSALIAQMQAQQLAQQQSTGTNPVDAMPEAVKAQASAIANQVISQMMAMMPSAQSADSSSTGEQGANAGGGGALGNASSAMGASTAEENIQKAAQSEVYNNIYQMLQKMQNTREAKAAIDEKITAINQQLAGKKSGDKVKVPVYEFDDESKELKFKGVKEMSYDEAVAMRDKLTNSKDALNEMSTEDMFYLQQFMEKKSQLEQMISNVMKANSETQSGLTGNLKAS